MSVKISTTNSKLSGQIPSVNLPPIITCRHNAPCAKLCYACKGNFRFANVQNSMKNNLDEFLKNSDNYFKEIIQFLNGGLTTYKYFRWHSSGDIVNEIYLRGMVDVAKKCKNVKFLAFTKKFELINSYLKNGGKIPNNLKIVFSAWDNTFKIENPYNLPTTYVFFKKEENNPIIPELAIPCVGKCYECQACWTLKNGQSVVFHQH